MDPDNTQNDDNSDDTDNMGGLPEPSESDVETPVVETEIQSALTEDSDPEPDAGDEPPADGEGDEDVTSEEDTPSEDPAPDMDPDLVEAEMSKVFPHRSTDANMILGKVHAVLKMVMATTPNGIAINEGSAPCIERFLSGLPLNPGLDLDAVRLFADMLTASGDLTAVQEGDVKVYRITVQGIGNLTY